MLRAIFEKVRNIYTSNNYVPAGGEFRITPWNEDEVFLAVMRSIEDHTLVDPVRCYMIYQLANQALNIEGDVAEVGVYKGGTAKLIAGIFQKTRKEIHLFDTFLGMPETDPAKDLVTKGDFSDTSLEQVASFLSEFKNVRLYKGIFPETADAIRDKSFSIVHLDVDIYSSVYNGVEYFYPRMSKGGILVFDDYGFKTCPGAKQAVDIFFAAKPEVPCYLPTGQAIVIKI